MGRYDRRFHLWHLSRQGAGASRRSGCGARRVAVGPRGPSLGQGSFERRPCVLAGLLDSPAETIDASRTGRIYPGGEVAGRASFAIMLERPTYGRKREFVPRDLFPAEELDFEAFQPCLDGVIEKPCPVDRLHLAGPRNVVDCQQTLDFDPRARFFPGLAFASRAAGFIEFEIAGAPRPKTTPWCGRTRRPLTA